MSVEAVRRYQSAPPTERRARWIVAIPIVGMLVLGCSPRLFNASRVSRQDEAGSSHIAILSVAPWERYRDAVQPAFKLQADDAVKMVLPDTLALEEKFLSAFSAKAKVGLPSTGTTSEIVTTTATGSAPSTSGTTTQNLTPGNASAITFEGSPAEGVTVSSLPPATSVLASPLGSDPMLRYWVATALYEEVQMLNRYVKDAAVAGEFVPYVLRMQVTLMPRRRALPYDAYTNVSFFQGDFATVAAAQYAGGPDSAPSVIPLLVTDDLEAAIHSRSVDKIRQLALAFAGMFNGVSVAGDLQKVDAELRTVLGRDFNSTFTIARASDNSVRLRFGAMLQSASQYAMIPQAHNVTLLVLVPKSYMANPSGWPTLRAVAKTTMVDAERGTELPPAWPSAVATAKECDAVIGRHGVAGADCSTLLKYVELNDYVGFSRHFSGYNEALWADLVALRSKSQWSYARVNLPRHVDPGFAPRQTASLLDDTKTSTTVTLRAHGELFAPKLAAVLTLDPPPHSGAKAIELPASATKISDDGRAVLFAFPSLKVFGQTGPDGLKPGWSASLDAFTLNEDGKPESPQRFPAIYVTKASDDPTFSLSARAKVIDTSKDGRGDVQVLADISKATGPVTMSVDGADVEGVSANVDTSDGKLTIVKSGAISLQLKNLNPVSNVTVLAKDKSTATKPIVFLVMQSPRK